MEPDKQPSAEILHAVREQLTVLTGMLAHQKALTVCVRYDDHTVTNDLVQKVRACLRSLLQNQLPGGVLERYGELVVGKCTVRVRAADATKAPDLIITVDIPAVDPAAP